ncbi:hypothetical protein OG203_17415 [Nocardia sp. NBC_01499]|uniref:hypothetical protein n=1 Tax=Nocardia sp. NBC_01499 TaxID=2903597 RepID=UPI0038703E28
MTSPDRNIPAGAYTGGSIRNLQRVTWESARASILSSVAESFAGVETIGTNMNAANDRALAAANRAQVGASSAQSAASSARSTSTANSSAIADLQTKQTQEQVGGASATDNFQNWDLTKWTVTKWVSGGDVVSDIVVVDDQAGISKSGNTGSGADLALRKTSMMTDDQSVSVVLGRPNQADTYTGSGILIRAAADLSTFVIAQVGTGRILLQRATLAGGALNITTWAEKTGLALGAGDTVTVTASGQSYEVLVNGVGRLNYRDAAASSPVGANNRWVGFYSGCNATASGDGSKSFWFGFDLDSFTAADTTSPSVVGTGWSLCRQNTATVAQSAGSARFGTIFDTALQVNNVNVLDLPSGLVQITKSGWYVMNVSARWAKSCGTGTNYNVSLWTAPSPDGQWKLVRSGGETEGATIKQPASTFVVFAAAGSVWAPGYYIAAANDMSGDASGMYTYFDGTLCSYS